MNGNMGDEKKKQIPVPKAAKEKNTISLTVKTNNDRKNTILCPDCKMPLYFCSGCAACVSCGFSICT